MKNLLVNGLLAVLLLSVNVLHAQKKAKPLKPTADDSQPILFKKSAAMVDHNYNLLDIKPQVLVDNPGNDFWNTYGQAPNMAFLISPEEVISVSQVFFDQEQMEKSIDLLVD